MNFRVFSVENLNSSETVKFSDQSYETRSMHFFPYFPLRITNMFVGFITKNIEHIIIFSNLGGQEGPLAPLKAEFPESIKQWSESML